MVGALRTGVQVRVAPPHLFFERARHHLGIELRSLFSDHDLKCEVEEYVAQLVTECLGIFRLDRVIQLEGFFDEVGSQGLRGLRAVPVTAGPQVAHERESTSKR